MNRHFLRTLPIASRMLATSLILVVLVIPVAGLLLSYNLREAVNTAFDERLESLLNVVLAGIEYDRQTDTLALNQRLGDARFDQVFSGWYWQISDNASRVLTSRSLWDQRLPLTAGPQLQYSTISGPNGETLRKLERDVRLPRLPVTLHVAVAADLSEVDAALARFEQLLWLSLVSLGILLLLGIWCQLHWGLEPLRRIRSNLQAVERGDCERLDTDLPEELNNLATAINTVLERDRQLMSRARTAAGNLAHAIKTPVSVMMTTTEQLPASQRETMASELKRLNEAVRHHLARASAAGPVVLRPRVTLSVALEPVFNGISRLAERKNITFQKPEVPPLQLQIDAQDLQEIVGNLLENALRWATSKVVMAIYSEADNLHLSIMDDGPGMSSQSRDEALQRGGRLDEQRSGSGLGLAIVSELIQLYDGQLQLKPSPMGGLLVTVCLPCLAA
ncbi:sensor histidine kinase [Porticoccus hydrocarbonoclasticus]|jgi:signal transduction histidine kinase|uniref:sensor histidine kinase n=1 Tax=Porticoccus hydrocarbonoclasticus TaxID=1073414 RepID=UPI000562CD5F|nr:HAMP domain-containing sensor histidine kinase [Porticoccus hydrocarbonoclasticus]|tara:strand:- start:1650 stop:2996 length:1347 start_codon:yes stop_codon:yes gene_type:complete